MDGAYKPSCSGWLPMLSQLPSAFQTAGETLEVNRWRELVGGFIGFLFYQALLGKPISTSCRFGYFWKGFKLKLEKAGMLLFIMTSQIGLTKT